MIRTEINCTTGEVTEVEMTPEEIEQLVAAQNEAQTAMDQIKLDLESKELLKASAKAKLVAGEPLTEEEAATIIF